MAILGIAVFGDEICIVFELRNVFEILAEISLYFHVE